MPAWLVRGAGWVLAWLLVLWRGRPATAAPAYRRVRPAAPRAKGQRKPEWVTRQLVLLKAHLPQAGCRTLALTFNRVFAHRQVSVSKSFVHRTLREHAHAVWLARRAMKAATPASVAVNHCWGLDLTGRADESGCVHTLLGVLDHGSRRVLALRRLPAKCGWTLLGCLCLTIACFGKPKFVRTDNERCFTGRVFTTGLRVLGIGHQRINLHCPWQNGRIERLFCTLKAVLKQITFDCGHTLDLLLAEFGRWYNELRPHQGLGGMTPLEAWDCVDAFHAPAQPKEVTFIEGWDGLLCGFHIRR